MIGRLRGTIVTKTATGVVLDVGGVGYDVAVTPRGLAALPPVGDDAVLHVHLHVREDQLALFGFLSQEGRDLFRTLIGVAGVGPKVGAAILATFEPEELKRAVLADDVEALQMVPGIGKRSAQKLILELRPRLDLPDAEIPGGGTGVLAEVRSALEGLGYQAAEIRAVTAQLPTDGKVEDLVRLALQGLGRANAP